MSYQEFLIRIFLCFIISFCIGLERQWRRRAIGLRTNVLVCIGSFLFVTFSIQTNAKDISRIAAQVVSGIGFLGAGTIIVTGKNKVRGLTTAAGLWACACMGLAIGAGFYSGAIIGCLVIAAVTVALANLDRKINRKSRNITLYILVNSTKAVSNLLKEIQSKNIKIRDIEISNNNVTSNEIIGILIGLKISRDVCPRNFIESISNKDEVIFFQEIN